MTEMWRIWTERVRLFLWDGMTLEEMCDCDRLLDAYGVRIDWDSMEDVVDGYTVDAEWEHDASLYIEDLRSTLRGEFDDAIRLMEDDE